MILDEFGRVVLTDDPDMDQIRKQYALMKNSANGGDYSEVTWAVNPSSLGRLSWRLLRHLYETSSAIRPAVDSIAREVSALPWMVIKKDFKYHPPSATAKINDFLAHPNLDNERLPTIIAQFIHDLLVIGKGTIEKVRNPFGELMELKARDASLYTPQVNAYGFIIDYIEYRRDTTTPARTHRKEDLIFEYFTPTSYTFGAIPIIETIVNEVALLMLCTKSLGWAFTKDDIPPGILHLGEIGEVALARAKASFEAGKGIANQHKLRVVDNVDKVEWVQFSRSNRDMQVAELIPMIERVVYRNFGLSPVESSQTDISRQVAGVSFKSSQSKMVTPVMEMIAGIINNDVVEEFDPNAVFMYNRTAQESFGEQAKPLMDLNDRGVITVNEARLRLGMLPVKGGDVRTYRLGNEVAKIDEESGEFIYREESPGKVATPALPED